MEGSSCDDHSVLLNNSSSFSSSEEDDDRSRNSDESIPSSDFTEDASSSSSSSTSSSSISNGPLYELSDLMSHLPINREGQGLSKYYQGKSQSFTSLASVKSKEELVKKENPYRKRMKSRYNKSNKCKYSYGPKATIAKKVSRGASFLSSPMMSKRSLGVSLMGTFRPPISIQKCSHSHQA